MKRGLGPSWSSLVPVGPHLSQLVLTCLPAAGVSSPEMLWAGVNITNHRSCQEAYNSSRVATVTDDQHICASGNDLKQAGCDPTARDGSCRGGVDACEVGGDVALDVGNVDS